MEEMSAPNMRKAYKSNLKYSIIHKTHLGRKNEYIYL